MTDRLAPDAPRPATAPTGDEAEPTLACAYSPRWLSGPSHYQGLVATYATDDQDPTEVE